jgi:exodeoxyribonuclease V beta subunit
MEAINFTQQLQVSHNTTGLYLIEASAGTGKTYTISNLYLRHILEGRDVSQILVVTFTNAATDELKGRIRQRLYEAYQNCKKTNYEDSFLKDLIQSLSSENQKKVKKRLDYALRSMDESAIYSIHGFCQKVLTEFAFLSGQPYQLEMNNNKDEWLYPIVLDWWRNNIATQESAIKFANYDAIGWTDYNAFQTFYNRIAEKAVKIQPEKLWENYQKSLQTCFEQLKKVWQKQNIIAQLIKSSCYNKRKTILKDDYLLSAQSKLDHYFEQETAGQFPKEISSLSFELLQNQLKAKFSEANLPETNFLKQVDNFIALNKAQLDIFIANSLVSAKATINKQVEQYKQKKQEISFHDLLSHLHKALNLKNGKALAQAIQQKYPVAFIDEFQDTDAIQYSIFNQIYFVNKESTLYMIGDPKQAIYSFRGGDIYTYIQAKQDLIENDGKIFTLNTNWRSTPKMIDAINSIFNKRKQDAFLYEKMIPFQPVGSPTKDQKQAHDYLVLDGKEEKALHFLVTENIVAKTIKPLSKEKSYELIDQTITNKIVHLLSLAQQGKARLGDNILEAKDIAILVPQHSDAQRLQKKLHAKGVQSVVASNTSVFQSEQATQLLVLLNAILDYKNHQLQRNALASTLVHLTFDEVYAFIHNEKQWSQWCESLKQLNQTWEKQGFISMFLQMVERLKLVNGMKRSGYLDRSLTNLMHLAELIQQASKKHSTMGDLTNWYATQIKQSNVDEAEMRLESDASLVKISTLHASKGLEYGVVFLPYLWGLKTNKDERPIYHKNPTELVLECDSSKKEQAQIKADYERLAEQVRLNYVALTRSVACCYIGWGNISNAKESALAYLLHNDQSPKNLQSHFANCATLQDDAAIQNDIEALASEDLLSYKKLELEDKVSKLDATKVKHGFNNKTFKGKIDRRWKINSYSRLTNDLDYIKKDTSAGKGLDAIFDFPAGKKVGTYLHEILEKIHFHSDIDEQIDVLNESLLAKYALPTEQVPVLKDWLKHIINTEFGEDGLTLKNIQPSKMLKEMEFNFSSKMVSIEQLNQLLKKYHPTIEQNITAEQFKGIINGIIDLVFEWNGKYYLLDYKSNLLGRMLEAYTPKKLSQEIIQHRYDLQYLLYSIALDRYCQSRIPNYSYDKDFGGVYYLFLRAMRVEHGKQYGSYFEKPNEALLIELAELF